MLPFTKRNVRNEEDVINTGDFEVLPDTKPAAGKPASLPPPAFPPPSGRARVFARSLSDDEMTTLMPRKGMFLSSRPPAPVTPVPMPKMPSSRPPRAMLEEPPTRQFMKPSSPPPPSVSPVAGPPRASNRAPAPQTPDGAFAPQGRRGQHQGDSMMPRGALRPQPVPVQAENLKSDPKIDVPATVITARTRIVAARPTMSWAAALVAMGIFVGLVTAVVARGDADTLIDAAAAFVDPSGAQAVAAGSESAVSLQTKADATPSVFASMTDTLAAAAPEATKVASVTDLPAAAQPLPARPAPVAYAAPRRAPVWHAPKAVAKHDAPKREAAEEKEERVAAAPAPKASGKKHADEDDMSGANAADALARAQLEASLQ